MTKIKGNRKRIFCRKYYKIDDWQFWWWRPTKYILIRNINRFKYCCSLLGGFEEKMKPPGLIYYEQRTFLHQ